MKKIKVGAVSYLNTKPLLYGIKNHPVLNEIELVEDYPSKIAELLINNKIDVGLVPVAIIPKLSEHSIITDYCIGADGAVASVCLFSDVPLEEIQEVYLDYQSRTSVNLAKVLFKEYWKKNVEFIDAKGEDFRNKINGSTAGVVIGDRALEQRSNSRFIYDLSSAWKEYTGLPFVFAAWIANKQLPNDFIEKFNEANKMGIENISAVVNDLDYTGYDLKVYFNININYSLDIEKRKGLKLFISILP